MGNFQTLEEIYKALIAGKKIHMVGDGSGYWVQMQDGFLKEFRNEKQRITISEAFSNPSFWEEYVESHMSSDLKQKINEAAMALMKDYSLKIKRLT